MSRLPKLAIFVAVFSLLGLPGVLAAYQEDDAPPPIIFDPDITITASTFPINPYQRKLDGQWQCSRVASDGKVYFGSSTHCPDVGGMFLQYDPATQQTHVLAQDINVICGEDANVYRPQGKLHSDLIEHEGYLYFATYYGYEGKGYPGGHVLRYRLGSYEEGAADIDDFGKPVDYGIIYSAITVDPVYDRIYVNSSGTIYRYNTDGTGKLPLDPSVGGPWANCFYHFTDSVGNLWTTSAENTGRLYKFDPNGSPSSWANALPIVHRPDDPNTAHWDQSGRFWLWGDKHGTDKFVFTMRQDGDLYEFDAAIARTGNIAGAFRKIAHIGIGGLDMCLAGDTIYWLQSARAWEAWGYMHDSKASDAHLKSIDIVEPNAPIYDWGRVIDPNGRTPYRCEGMSADEDGHVYLSGDWRVLPEEIGTPVSTWRWWPEQSMYIDLWRGQYFAVIDLNLGNEAPNANAGVDQTITWPTNTVSLDGTVMDDGLPEPPSVTVTWSKQSGPGTVSFANLGAVDTTATFSTLGTYVLRLTASDGELTDYDEATITVRPVPTNTAPSVSAGNDRQITWPTNTVSLDATVTDDGLPNPPAAFTVTWSKQSGAGTVTFANLNAVDTTATFSTLGTYILRLTANDSVLTAYDEMAATVSPQAPATLLLHLPMDEGSGTVAADISGNSRNGALLGGPTWPAGRISGAVHFDEVDDRVVVGDFLYGPEFSIAFWFKADDNVGSTYQYIFCHCTVDAANSVNVFLGEQDEPDVGNDLRTLLRDADDAAPTFSLDTPAAPDGLWHLYTLTVKPGQGAKVYLDASLRMSDAARGGGTFDPNSQLYLGGRIDLNPSRFYGGGMDDVRIYNVALTIDQIAALIPAANTAPSVNAGTDQVKTWPTNTASLDGTVTDDGLPSPPAATTVSWTKQSGPGTVTFAGSTSVDTTATFSTVGTYLLRLTASDSVLTAYDEMSVRVNPPANQAPTVAAGNDQAITLPAAASLDGTVTDDGQPSPPASTTKTWSKQSGAGTVTFANAGAEDTTATFSTTGTYVLRLTASDSVLSAYDETSITVLLNLPPAVSAGVDQAKTWPTNTASLDGTVTDDGLPSPPASTTKTWSKQSGAGTVTFANAGAEDTTATFSTVGTYVLRLTASDSVLSAYDETSITVLLNLPPAVSAGVDQAKTWPTNTASLDGTVTDDGLPSPPASTTKTWSKQSGAGTVTFANASAEDTTATFSTAGTYVLRLTASDSVLSAYDEMSATVNPADDLAADFNGDGQVTGADFVIWQAHYPTAYGADKADGDANGDGAVTGMDFVIWQTLYAP